MGAEPGQNLSCPHSAHGGSRDLPRGTGGPPGEVGVDCGLLSVGGKDTDSEGLRRILLLVLSFSLFFLFVFCFILFCCCFLFFNYILFFTYFFFTFFFFCFNLKIF